LSGAVLAIEATTSMGSLALRRPDGSILERPLPPSREHAAQLMPAIAALLEAAEVQGESLAAIVCATGPGSFTGVRIALATAHGLSLGWSGIPLFAATTTLTLAAGAQVEAGEGVVPLIDARKKEFYCSRIRGGVEVDLTHEPATLWWNEILPAWAAEGSLVLIGDALDLPGTPSDLPAGVRLAPPETRHPQARHLLTLHAQGRTVGPLSPVQLQPTYVRPPDAIPPKPIAG